MNVTSWVASRQSRRRSILRSRSAFAFVTGLVGISCTSGATTVSLSGEQVRVSVSDAGPNSEEVVQFRDGNSWKSSLQTQAPVIRIRNVGRQPANCILQNVSRTASVIVTRGVCGSASFERTLELGPDPDIISVTVHFNPGRAPRLISVEDRLTFAPEPRHSSTPLRGPLDFVWSQNIKAVQDDLIAHWAFKSPTVMFQQREIFAAIVPRVDLLTADNLQHTPTALDLDVTSGKRAWFSYGAVSSKPTGHSYFVQVNDTPLQDAHDSLEYAYWIVTGPQPDRLGYRRITHLLWEKFGSTNLKNSIDLQRNVVRPDLFLFDSWRQEAWTQYAEEKFWDEDCGPHIRCGAISSNRNPWGHWNDAPKRDAWFNAWFQTLRSAYGWFLYARRTQNLSLQQKAEEVLNLALTSPQHEGMFSTIYLADTKTWLPDDGWAGFSSDYHTFCMSWTAYWMLRWATDLVPERKNEILAYLRPYADFLLKAQQSSGAIPSWFHADLTPRTEFRDFNAETAGSALFLAEFSAFANGDKYLKAAIHAQQFIAEAVIPRERWYDFETFFSCARKPISFYDSWTAQYPQNNLSTIQAAMAYLRIFELTNDSSYLASGQHVLDYLLLTQQVWNHPLLTPMLVGGTTTQNTDAEWSDARECYLAAVLLDYYKQNGNLDYLERAVAAARSGFAVAPWENWAHNGYNNEHGALTGFHWGTGSEMASVEMLSGLLGDAFVNAKLDHGVGFNGCTMQDVAISGNKIALTLKAALTPRDLLIRFSELDPTSNYILVINGRHLPISTGKELLQKGYLLHL